MLSDDQIALLQHSITINRKRHSDEVKNRDEEIAQLHADVESLKTIITKHQDHHASLKERMVKVISENELLSDRLEQERVSTTKLSSELQKSQSTLDNERLEKEFIRKRLSEAESLIAQIPSLRSHITELELSVHNSKEQNRLLVDSKQSLDSQVQLLTRDIEGAKWKHDSLESRIETLTKEKTAIVDEASELKQTLAKIKTVYSEELADLRRDLSRTKELLDTERAHRARIEASEEASRRAEEDAKKQVADAISREKDAVRDLRAVEDEMANLRIAMNSAKSAVDEKERTHGHDIEARKALEAELIKVQSALDAVRSSANDMNIKYDTLRAELTGVRSTVHDSVSYITDIVTTVRNCPLVQSTAATNAAASFSGGTPGRNSSSVDALYARAAKIYDIPVMLLPRVPATATAAFSLSGSSGMMQMVPQTPGGGGGGVGGGSSGNSGRLYNDVLELVFSFGMSDALGVAALQPALQILRDVVEWVVMREPERLPAIPVPAVPQYYAPFPASPFPFPQTPSRYDQPQYDDTTAAANAGALMATIARLEEEKSRLQEQYDRLKDKYDSYENDSDGRVRKLREEIDEMRRLQGAAPVTGTTIPTPTVEMVQVAADTSHLDRRIVELEGLLETERRANNEAVETHTKALEALRSQLKGIQEGSSNSSSELLNRLSGLEVELLAERQAKGDLQYDLDVLKEKLVELEKLLVDEKAVAAVSASADKQRIAALEVALEAEREEKKKIGSDVDKANAVIKRLMKELQILREQTSSGTLTVEEVTKLQSDLQRSNKHYQVLKNAVVQLEKQLKAQGDEYITALGLADARIRGLQQRSGGSGGSVSGRGSSSCRAHGGPHSSVGGNCKWCHRKEHGLTSSSPGRPGAIAGSSSSTAAGMSSSFLAGGGDGDSTLLFQATEKLRVRSIIRGKIVGIYRQCLFALKDGRIDVDKLALLVQSQEGQEEAKAGPFDDDDEEERHYGVYGLDCLTDAIGGPKMAKWLDKEMSTIRSQYEGEVRTLQAVIEKLRTDTDKLRKKNLSLKETVKNLRQDTSLIGSISHGAMSRSLLGSPSGGGGGGGGVPVSRSVLLLDEDEDQDPRSAYINRSVAAAASLSQSSLGLLTTHQQHGYGGDGNDDNDLLTPYHIGAAARGRVVDPRDASDIFVSSSPTTIDPHAFGASLMYH